MTAKQILDFAEKHAHEKDMFNELSNILESEKIDLVIKLEEQPNNKKLLKQFSNVKEKLRIISLMKNQRLELFYQSGI